MAEDREESGHSMVLEEGTGRSSLAGEEKPLLHRPASRRRSAILETEIRKLQIALNTAKKMEVKW